MADESHISLMVARFIKKELAVALAVSIIVTNQFFVDHIYVIHGELPCIAPKSITQSRPK
jgi:hypothetical protein